MRRSLGDAMRHCVCGRYAPLIACGRYAPLMDTLAVPLGYVHVSELHAGYDL